MLKNFNYRLFPTLSKPYSCPFCHRIMIEDDDNAHKHDYYYYCSICEGQNGEYEGAPAIVFSISNDKLSMIELMLEKIFIRQLASDPDNLFLNLSINRAPPLIKLPYEEFDLSSPELIEEFKNKIQTYLIFT